MNMAEIEREALNLPRAELRTLTARLDTAVAAQVDADFDWSARAGAFDSMAEEALREHRAGATQPLDDLLDER